MRIAMVIGMSALALAACNKADQANMMAEENVAVAEDTMMANDPAMDANMDMNMPADANMDANMDHGNMDMNATNSM